MSQDQKSEKTVSVSVSDTRYVLKVIGEQYPELEMSMTIADALLLRLASISHEVKLPISLAIQSADEVDRSNLEKAIKMLSRDKHELTIQTKSLYINEVNDVNTLLDSGRKPNQG